MATQHRINLVGLDFDEIRGNLKEYLRGQSKFSDFDFEGSNLSILLDVLAYNTHYNAVYTNMALNEVFIDSATKRSSVVQIARALGYTPKAYTAAKANINFTVTGVSGNPPVLTVPRGSQFFTTSDDKKFTFITASDYTVARSTDGKYYFTGVKVLEGRLVSTRFVVTPNQTFVIPNKNIDIDTLTVKVNNSATYSYFEQYVSEFKFTDIDKNTNVYFLKETHDGYIEIEFGDNIFGKRLETGNTVDVEYVITSGSIANGIKRGLSFNGLTLSGGNVIDLTITSLSQGGTYGGSDPETIEEIRHNAPNYYAAQNRAVTAKDYAAIITARQPIVDHCISWGGEVNIPPVYGKVFICVKTVDETPLTYDEKQDIIENIINPVKTVTVIPQFVDPNYIRIIPDIVIYYDPRKTGKTQSDISAMASSVVSQYSFVELEKFNKIYRKTQLSRLIEFVDDSILSTVIRTKLSFDLMPTFNVQQAYELNVRIPFVHNTIQSTVFYSANVLDSNQNLANLHIQDDGIGNLQLYRLENGVKYIISHKFGTVDYANGLIKIPALNVYNYNTESIKFYATPSVDDIAGINNNVISIDTSSMQLAIIKDETAGRDTTSYIYTSNRL